MKVLVIGSGGREHAICWGIKKNKRIKELYCAPGNGGISDIAHIVDIKSDNLQELLNFALAKDIDLTIVGPEQPLSLGIVDLFKKNELLIFGPDKNSSQLESSKEYSKNFMKRNNIPTANFETFTEFEKAHKYIKKSKFPIVLKADGLAAGKGVRVCYDYKEADEFLTFLMKDKIFAKSGEKVVIESFLEGEEASFFVFTDGHTILPLDSSQDHKRLLDQDRGPNTGGMGAYSPAPVIDDETRANIMNEVVIPVFNGGKAMQQPIFVEDVPVVELDIESSNRLLLLRADISPYVLTSPSFPGKTTLSFSISESDIARSRFAQVSSPGNGMFVVVKLFEPEANSSPSTLSSSS